ncbi:MAG TPA: hypothetical protein VFM46_08710 [Pseudomonadales bacterium]|nr:hypothetical protein [Pseudomonadales bacterium]
MASIGNVQRFVAICFSALLMTACGGGGGGGGAGSPASVVENNPGSDVQTKAALDRSNALFLAGSALAVSSASANLYDFFALTQQIQPTATAPVRMSARTMARATASYTCANGSPVSLEESSASGSQISVAHFSNCRLSDTLLVSGDITVTQTGSSADLSTQDFQIEKSGKRYLYTVNSHQTWAPNGTSTVIQGSESVSIKSADNAWTVSSNNLALELTVDNATAATLSQTLTAKIDSSNADSVQLVNNRIYGDKNTSIKVGGNYLFWDLMKDDANIDLELDDDGDYTADFFNTIAYTKLLDDSAKTSNHAPVLSAKNQAYYAQIASSLSINATDADSDFLSYDWTLVSATHSNYFLEQTRSSHPAFGATEPGTFEFSVTVSDGSASQTLNLTVNVAAIDPSQLDGLGTALNDLELGYGENLNAQLSMANEDLSGAELRVLRGPDGFCVSQNGVLSWTNDHVYDGGQFNYSFGILRNGYWEKIWYGHVFPAAQ